jgi:CDP-ribitol ribitolphosphotransferase
MDESCHRRQSPGSLIKDIFLVATSRVCILDGYNPAVSIPKVDRDLLVIQVWHALGAIKMFGWQAVGTTAGRSRVMAETFGMHRNYTAVVAAGEGCVPAFAEAFGCAEDAVKPLGMPKMEYLMNARADSPRLARHQTLLKKYPQLLSEKINVLYAPTFRAGEDAGNIGCAVYAAQLAAALPRESHQLIVNAHPFSAAARASHKESSFLFIPHTRSVDLLECADYVITDYSAIAFEAALLKKKVLVFVPDIDAYRVSPGLNIDVEALFPQVSFRHTDDLTAYLVRDSGAVRETEQYESCGFWTYCNSYLVKEPSTSLARVGALISTLLADHSHVSQSQGEDLCFTTHQNTPERRAL